MSTDIKPDYIYRIEVTGKELSTLIDLVDSEILCDEPQESVAFLTFLADNLSDADPVGEE